MTPDRKSGVISCPDHRRVGAALAAAQAPAEGGRKSRPYAVWRNKKGPEKSDPTPLSYHSIVFKSTPKWSAGEKICALHKNECLHLGNIPS